MSLVAGTLVGWFSLFVSGSSDVSGLGGRRVEQYLYGLPTTDFRYRWHRCPPLPVVAGQGSWWARSACYWAVPSSGFSECHNSPYLIDKTARNSARTRPAVIMRAPSARTSSFRGRAERLSLARVLVVLGIQRVLDALVELVALVLVARYNPVLDRITAEEIQPWSAADLLDEVAE